MKRLQLKETQKDEVCARLQAWLANKTSGELDKSIQLRIADASARQDRLTDLLVDGTITRPDFELRKQNTVFELQRLREELGRIQVQQKNRADLNDLVEFAANLHAPFACGTPQEQRLHLKNCAAVLRVRNGQVVLTAQPWLKELKRLSQDTDATPSFDVFNKHTVDQFQAHI